MEEQNNTEMNSQPQVQTTENVQTTTPNETKPPKKKRNWLFTLFACIMTAIIVALAMNIGQQLSKGMEKKSSGTSNSNSNEVSNSNSNETSNSNSNETTNCNTTEPKTKVYTNKDVAGAYTYETTDMSYSVELYSNGFFTFGVSPKGPACGMSTRGSYYIDGESIILNSIVSHSCDGQGSKSISVTSAKIDNGNIILSENLLTPGNQKKLTNVKYTKANEKIDEEKTEDFIDMVYSVIVQGAEINKQN